MNERQEKIKKLWKEIHGFLLPEFRWWHYPHMMYRYNAEEDTIECDYGHPLEDYLEGEELSAYIRKVEKEWEEVGCVYSIGLPINLKTEEITRKSLARIIWKLEAKVHKEFLERYNIDLGFLD